MDIKTAKLKILAKILIMLSAIVVGASLSGCVNDSKSEANELIKMLPYNYNGFVYVNFETLKGEESSQYRSKILNTLKIRDTNGDETGIYINKTKRMIFGGSSYDNFVMIIEGDYDFDKFKNHLKKVGINPTEEYNGFKIYSKPNEEFALTIYKDMIIAGTKQGVRECIDVIKGKEESLLKNEGVMDIYNKLPSDACVYEVRNAYDPWDKTIADGSSISFENNNMVKVVRVEKYKDEETAKEKYEELLKKKEMDEEDIKKKGIKVDIKLDGQYVIVEVEGPEDEANF
ncbi:MAG: hypothetical protein GXN95_03020 [Methanococci archaeon]|nr:hypothetical protein [Methanococci archaeon]